MKRYYHLFIIISFVFLILALAKIDYLSLPQIHSVIDLGISLTLLPVGFMAEALVWKVTSRKFGCPITFRDSVASIGLSVFGKYIPGKVWLIVGRAGYLNQHYPHSIKELAYVALVSQMLLVVLGLGFGLVGVWNIPSLHPYSWILLAGWIIALLVLIHPFIHDKVSLIVNRITKGKISLPVLEFKAACSLIPVYIGRWIVFSVAYYFLIASMTGGVLPWYVATVFPLAGTLGLLVFFIPGGIGVREGIMVFLLSHMGIDTASAVGLSIAARLWVVIGEAMIFLFGLTFRRGSAKERRS